jgi:ABC-type uncharacterized transport system permease subunit
MIQLMYRSLKYNLSAHLANLPNLVAGALGMLINNTLFLTGLWGMLFAGKPENEPLLFYFVALNALVMTAWGGINFFFGGWIDLGELITNGQFESKLSTPRHPLVLVATHFLHPSALGDLFMGLFGIGVLCIWGPPGMGVKTLIACGFSTVALFSLYIFSGSLAFFLPRGNVVALLIREMVVSLSVYPMGKIFPSGLGRIILLLTPAAAVSLLPLEWIETPGWGELGIVTLAVTITLVVALWVYSKGVRRFQAINLVGPQS